jgi:tetratricopeptide (TPR) repeat protein
LRAEPGCFQNSFVSIPAPSRASSPWLYGPGLDLLVGCGAWSLPLLAGTLFLQREHALEITFVFYLLAVFCNNPHYMATIYRAYRTRDDFNKYKFFTVYVTVLMAGTLVLVHTVPALFPWVVTLYLTWSPWHYTGQNFGIAQMFVRRSGGSPDVAARHWLFLSYASSFAVWCLTLHSTRESDPNFLSLRIPATVVMPLQIFFAVAFAGCATAAFVRLARNLRPRQLLPPLLLTCTQLVWFVVPALFTRFGILQLPVSYFSAGALAFMHCAQYLWITSYYAAKERSKAETARPFSFWRYYSLLVVGGLALFIPGPWLASRLLGHDFVESFVIFMALVNVHHFILDGAVWKLRDGRIARFLLGKNAPETGQLDHEKQSPTSHLDWLLGPSGAARATRFAVVLAILAIGALDQLQFLATRRDASANALSRAAFINPHDTRVHFRRAQKALAEGDTARAQTELARIIAINPRNAPAQHLLGQLIFKSGDVAAALAHYDRMAELFRPDLSSALNRGLLQQHSGNPTRAAALFEQALSLAPHRTELHFLLAEALMAAGNASHALKQYELFATLFEQNPGAEEERQAGFARYFVASRRAGELQVAAGDFKAAQTRLQAAADIAATYRYFGDAADLLGRLATVQEQLGLTDQAAKNRAAAAQATAFAR